MEMLIVVSLKIMLLPNHELLFLVELMQGLLLLALMRLLVKGAHLLE